MPRRVIVVAFTAVVVLVAVGAPATAKGPDSATITGPGIGTKQLSLNDPDHSLDAFVRITRLWDGERAPWTIGPPAGDLGPRYELTYHVPDLYRPSSGKAQLIHQELYPFAAAGPVVQMAAGQAMYDNVLGSGWLSTGHRLTALVKRLGATTQPVDSPAIEPAAHAEDASSDGPAWGLIVGGAIGAAIIATAAAALLRRRVHGQV